MMHERKRARICPQCKAVYTGYPALSRNDNETLICPDCGTREALTDMGVSADEQNAILEIIKNNTQVER